MMQTTNLQTDWTNFQTKNAPASACLLLKKIVCKIPVYASYLFDFDLNRCSCSSYPTAIDLCKS